LLLSPSVSGSYVTQKNCTEYDTVTSYEQQCIIAHEQECEQHCLPRIETVCDTIEVQECSIIYQRQFLKSQRHVCVTNLEQQCTEVYEERCHEVPRENCEQVPKQICHQVPRESCQQVPRKRCRLLPLKRCQYVPRQSCSAVPKENCHDVVRQDCQQGFRNNCRSVPKEHCVSVPVQKQVAREACTPSTGTEPVTTDPNTIESTSTEPASAKPATIKPTSTESTTITLKTTFAERICLCKNITSKCSECEVDCLVDCNDIYRKEGKCFSKAACDQDLLFELQ